MAITARIIKAVKRYPFSMKGRFYKRVIKTLFPLLAKIDHLFEGPVGLDLTLPSVMDFVFVFSALNYLTISNLKSKFTYYGRHTETEIFALYMDGTTMFDYSISKTRPIG